MSETVRYFLKRDYIVEQLRAAIASGELQPGQKLRQEELAARFQISSTPVREALRLLEAEGLVTSVPHQGVFVTRLTAQEAVEYYRLRALLEAYAAKEAVVRLKGDDLRRTRLLEQLEEIQQGLNHAIDNKNIEEAANLNRTLHLLLYEEAAMPLLKQLITDLWKRMPFHNIWLGAWRTAEIEAEHRELLEAIRSGDPVAAERITRLHIELSLEVFLASTGENLTIAASEKPIE